MDVTVRQGVQSTTPLVELARSMARALDAAGAPAPASIGLVLSDDRELRRLNEEHMGAPGPTDVLSFPLVQPEAFPRAHGGRARRGAASGALPGGVSANFVLPPGRRVHLGDIVVSVERANEQAHLGRGGQTGDVRWSSADELRLLVVHGVLHVCGWDHAEPADERAMRALERRLLARENL
jgi:probable rRNA maturation factor